MGSLASLEVPNKHIVFFDGYCNLCSSSVDFVMRHDPQAHFIFESLQSENASLLLGDKLPKSVEHILVLTTEKEILKKSAAVFFVARYLKGWPRIIALFRFLPNFIADFFYMVVARNRYRIFGKKDTCRMPTQEEKLRFLEGYQNK